MEYFRIDKSYLKDNISTFISIIEKVPNEYWSENHFLMDLTGKWEYSVGLRVEGNLVAFIIASIKEGGIHIHKFMVHEQFRSLGIGKLLLDYFIKLAKENSKSVTLKVYKDNHRAIKFYITNGFSIINEDTELIKMRREML